MVMEVRQDHSLTVVARPRRAVLTEPRALASGPRNKVRRARNCLCWIGAALLGSLTVPAAAQTTQGLIAGRVYDATSRKPVPDARISYWRIHQDTVVEASCTQTNQDGQYAILFLSPGIYNVRVEPGRECRPEAKAPGREERPHQPQETDQLELFVASRLELNFSLRRLREVWANGTDVFAPGGIAVVHFYAADVGSLRSAYMQLVPATTSPLDASVSYVIDPPSIQNLPLSGRDVYSTLVLQPAVTADRATARGLGLSIAGQRPTSSNFLLDGLENNNRFLTGPSTPISPEAIQEYRVSASNFSAEYGGTGGFLANAVTRAGGNRYHGLLFAYAGNELLNANTFNRNAWGVSRRLPSKQLHAGYQIGGPILKDRLFFSSEFEQFRSRDRQDPQPLCVPAVAALASFSSRLPAALGAPNIALNGAPASSAASFIGGVKTTCPAASNLWQIAPTTSIDRSLGLERFDFATPSQADRVMFRIVLARGSRPDFVYSPYQGFNSRLSEDSTGAAVRWIRTLGPRATNELRMGWTNFDLHWNRPFSQIPAMQISSSPVRLPGSELPYDFTNRENDGEISDSLSFVHGRHVITAGGGFLMRYPRVSLSYYRDGAVLFQNAGAFASATPGTRKLAVRYDPQGVTGEQPNFLSRYTNHQGNLFAQDNVRIGARVNLAAGVRYESFGTFRLDGPLPVLFQPGVADARTDQVAKGSLVRSESAFYQPDRNNWSARIGASYRAASRLLVRGSYGLFYDRPFDNALDSSRLNGIFTSTIACGADCLSEPALIVSKYRPRVQPPPDVVWWIDRDLRAPRIERWFTSIQPDIGRNWAAEISYLGARSSNLLATSVLSNKSIASSITLPDLRYLSNSGFSNYQAMSALLSYRVPRGQIQVAYTLSHTIDNQSDPLLGHILDLSAASTGQSATPADKPLASFSEEFNSRIDKGNSDFDQRHNLVMYSIWTLPQLSRGGASVLLNGWQVAQVTGVRSGFPVNVFAFAYLRPNITGNVTLDRPVAEPGQRQLLDPDAFSYSEGLPLGRNSIRGPGFWNSDLSLAKSFSVRRLGDAGSIQFRADFFNVFNHANLSPPDPYFSYDNPGFGLAAYGQNSRQASFPALIPLSEQQRRIQLQLKLYF